MWGCVKCAMKEGRAGGGGGGLPRCRGGKKDVETFLFSRPSSQMCVSYSKQFTHLGNIVETTK